MLNFNEMERTERHRFGSFSPVRESSRQVKWLVDGEAYMSAVADAIVSAHREILITDWQMSPYLHMKRPVEGVVGVEWRLDKLLLKKANQGVRIHIMLYWETQLAMDLGSNFVLSVLNHHENISIVRHPTYSTFSTNLRWSHHEKLVVIDRDLAFVGGIDLCFGRWDTYDHVLSDEKPLHPSLIDEAKNSSEKNQDGNKRNIFRRWIGKDYGNVFLAGARMELDNEEDSTIKDEAGVEKELRKLIPRMPWHDVSCCFNGESALDVTKHFIQRYNHIVKDKDQLVLENSEDIIIPHNIPNPTSENVNIQVLRSVADWSSGQPHEYSIYNAYIDAIRNSKHFIYIENQFFISSQPDNLLRNVKNEIQQTLAQRIMDAYEKQQAFHVMIILPLKPEFPEEWNASFPGDGLRAVSYWNYATLFRGENSLFGRLGDRIPQEILPRYISVYGLRKYDVLNEKLVTEIIYVHSKLMIVDDTLTIIGSANINDRSMLGDRDSEVNVIIEDKVMIDGTMDGKPFPVGEFSHKLRTHLMKEHLGLLKDVGNNLDVKDPIIWSFCEELGKVAINNHLILKRVFQGMIIPCDDVWNFDDLENFKQIKGMADYFPQEAKEELKKIQGHIVLYPRLFLKDVLKPSYLDYASMFVDSRGKRSALNLNDNPVMMA